MPQHVGIVSKITIPALLGEVVFALWLLVVGARAQPSDATARSPS